MHGAPDIFTTFTCNPKWLEIAEALLSEPGQKPRDRADIVVRVFSMKLDEYLDEIKSGRAYGPIRLVLSFLLSVGLLSEIFCLVHMCYPVFLTCYCFCFPVLYSVEFQKRGLPHAHILVWLKGDHSKVSADVIDSFVCAEIPDPLVDPLGYSLVSEFMMHDPCGDMNDKCVCMKKVSALSISLRVFKI